MSLNPVFNFINEKGGLYCAKHKENDMIDVKSKKCVYNDCITQPSFGLYNKITHCKKHKTDDMSKPQTKCTTINCKKKAIFTNSFNERPSKCEDHSSPLMLNVNKKYICSVKNCETEYLFTYKKKNYCEEHCPDKTLTNSRFCKYCDMSPSSIYICKECTRNRHPKEASIVRVLTKNINKESILDSSSKLDGCSKKRPDILYECNTHNVIVEVDEHQHRSYASSCECSRANELFIGLGCISLTIIRFNFDTIKNKDKVLEFTTDFKHTLLLNTVKHEIDVTPESDIPKVKLIQLFYDDNNNTYSEYKEEDITNIIVG